MRDFRRLKVWRKSHQLVLDIYEHTGSFPTEERYGLISQVRRSAVSIPANIAEGYGHDGDKELVRYLRIAQSSSSELSYHLLLSKDLGYLKHHAYADLRSRLHEVQSMIVGLTNTVIGR